MNNIHYMDSLLGIESHLSREKLESAIKKFRVSNDFFLAQDVNLKPGELTPVKVKLDKNLFPEVGIITLGMFKHLEISMRSCFAQSGIHILGNFFEYIDMDDIKRLNQDGSVDIEVSVINRGLADVEVKDGGAFFRLYFRPGSKAITGKQLYEIIQEGKLKIEGDYGTTWSLVGTNIPTNKKEINRENIENAYESKDLKEDEIDASLTLKLKLNGNTYIPNNKHRILIESKKNLVDILEPFDNTNREHIHHNFNIGETYYVDFGEYFGVIIYQGYDGGGHHIISPLIDPGFKGPIRTEIVKGNTFNDFIELHIYHKDG